MYREKTILKKSLSKPRYRQVLEIIGLSQTPLSPIEIARKWEERYPATNYLFEVIKNLYKLGHLHHAERFLSISYNERSSERISVLEAKLEPKPGGDKEVVDGYEISVKTIRSRQEYEEDFKRTQTELEISKIKNNHRNWKYRLNLKGLLLYLISAHYHNEEANRIVASVRQKKKQSEIEATKQVVSIKTIDCILENFIRRSDIRHDLIFLQYLIKLDDIYGSKTKVRIMTDIALELQYQLKILVPEYLKYYIIRRCYDVVAESYAIENNYFFKRLSSAEDMQKKSELKVLKIKILKDLIPFEEQTLKNMKKDLEITEKVESE